MDDKSVFNNNPPQNNAQGANGQNSPTPTQDEQRLTLNDLYGPSNPQEPAQTQTAPPVNQPQIDPNQGVAQQPQVSPQMTPEMQPPATAQPEQMMQTVQSTTQVPDQQYAQTPYMQSSAPPPAMPPAPPPFPPSNFPLGLLANPKAKLFLIGGVVLFLLIIVVMIFGIGRGRGGNNSEKVTLTYWGLWDDSKVIQPIINDFQKEHPNITITYKKESTKQYKERVRTRSDNGIGPDIFTYHNTWLPTMKSMLAPLPSDVIKPDEFEKTYFPVVKKDLSANGAIYGLPQGIDTIAMFINKEIFEAAGLNVPDDWDEFATAAKALTVKDEHGKIKTAGTALGTYDNINHAPDIAALTMVQNNVDFENLGGTRDNLVGALSFYSDFAITRGGGNVWDDSMDPSLLSFTNGKVAMYFGYSWDIFQIIANNPDLKFEVFPVPNGPDKKATVASYWVNGVSSKSKHQVEAMLFMKFLAQKKVAEKIYTEQSKVRLFGTPYARIDLAKTLESNPLVAPFVQQASFAQSSIFSSDTHDSEYNEKLNNYLGDAVRGAVYRFSAESSADTLINGVQQVRTDLGL